MYRNRLPRNFLKKLLRKNALNRRKERLDQCPEMIKLPFLYLPP
ncbi:hypothetical protein PS943_01200 [Pseudomonas fluorescens]|uniref:Uncharacterized protein n=1 Tax=Pseudomonas fluorescens TaxID=294 RepID=A0A5E7W2P2_PSEFL|nr:hypothetical protein PS943_01200 [Pseudomonas fluorescens]